MTNFMISALYKFCSLPEYEQMQSALLDCCRQHEVKGTLLLAAEGINGTIAGSTEGVTAVLDFLKSDPRMADLAHKESFAPTIPFYRMKVKLKKEIVTIGIPEVDPTAKVGTYVPPEEWNQLLADPDLILIDTRNEYEFKAGSFQGAINPHTNSFRDFPAYVAENLHPQKHKKIAMFCTGGIRCEKATSFLLQEGFEEVFHLQGGILNYLEKMNNEQSVWDGECFVFDNRVTVNHDLEPGSFDMCHGCRMPLTQEELTDPRYIPGISCHYCIEDLTPEKRARLQERQKQIGLAKERDTKHIGVVMPHHQ